MSLPGTVKWVLLALVGLAIAIGVAIAAANLTSQQIGIASESVSAGDALAPSLHVPAEKKPGEGPGQRPEPPEGTAPTAPAEPPTIPFEEPIEEASPPEEAAEPPAESESQGEGESDSRGGGGGGGGDSDD